jgi:hypothetical protein
MKCGIFLGIIDEVNADLRNNYFATTEEPRIKGKRARAEQDKGGGYRSQIEGS